MLVRHTNRNGASCVMETAKNSVDKQSNFFVFYGLFTMIVGIFFTLLLFNSQAPESQEIVD